jgi:hypothetical protein
MGPLTTELVDLILSKIPGRGPCPIKTSDFIYDPKFTPDWLIEYISENDDQMWLDGAHCFEHIFNEIDKLAEDENLLQVCASEEIGEEYPSGYYTYYTGKLSNGVDFLYHQSPSHIEYASRLDLYGEYYTLLVRGDSIYVRIYESLKSTLKLFTIIDERERIEAIKTFLKRSKRTTFEEVDY